MEWTLGITLILTFVSGIGFLYKEIKTFEKEIRDEVRAQAQKSDKLFETVSARSDRLYEMFIDLLKETKK